MIVYKNTGLEHHLDKCIGKEIIVSVVDVDGFEIPVACVTQSQHLKSVAKHYIEEGKRVFIFLGYSKFDTSLQIAKDLGCGVVFECGSKFENASKANPVEIERLAGQNGISQNIKRIAAIYANSVPFSMTYGHAEKKSDGPSQTKIVLPKQSIFSAALFRRTRKKQQRKMQFLNVKMCG